MSSYHITNLGKFAPTNAKADLDGYIHTTEEAVLAGRWDDADGELEYRAQAIAERNAAAIDEANAACDEWNEDY
jgi:hypothetical protein